MPEGAEGVQIGGRFLMNTEELSKGISNRYGHHKRLVRKSQLRDKLNYFLAPRDQKGEIPKQPMKENAKLMENVPLGKTYVPFINERGAIGHIIPKDKIEAEMRNRLFNITPAKFQIRVGAAEDL